jgi:murein DD-endopeptidase MepM/ murein hydrolase activator NlpD
MHTTATAAALGLLAATVTLAAPPQLRVSSLRPKPGDPVVVTVVGVHEEPRGTVGETPLVFFPVKSGWQAVFAVPVDEPPPQLKVAIEGTSLARTLSVRSHTFPEHHVTVAPELAEPPPEKRKQIEEDNAAILEATKQPEDPQFHGLFRRPVPGVVTSGFGSVRIFNDLDYRSRHFGADFAGKEGTPVRAIEAGKVALVRDGFLTGGTVVVVHGGGVASTYFHLSDITVGLGDEIQRGTVVGKVGLTGRTTGPHLHLGVRVPGGYVDPAVFLALKLGPV